MRPPTPARQQGKHNVEKEKRKNRNLNRKALADIAEDKKDIKDAIAIDLTNSSNSLLSSVRDSIPVPISDTDNHAKVEANRPKVPSWFQKQEAFTPSRSYFKKKEDED